MSTVFADTSFFLALLNVGDVHHQEAVRQSQQPGNRVLTEFILLELGNAMSRSKARARFVQIVADLRQNPRVMIQPCSPDYFEKGFQLFSARNDKDWSLTDCTSFVVMQEQGLTEALTADHHFEQAGFSILLK